MQKFLLFLGLCWMIALWTWTSPLPISHYLKNLWMPRRLVTTGAVVLFLFQLFTGIPARNEWFVFGVTVFIAGIALASWAKFVMQHNWGEPGQHDIKQQNILVTGGPFAFSRNPIYVGLLLIFLGFEIAVESLAVALSIPLVFLLHRTILMEESLLLKHFGKTYVDYQKRVRRYA